MDKHMVELTNLSITIRNLKNDSANEYFNHDLNYEPKLHII